MSSKSRQATAATPALRDPVAVAWLLWRLLDIVMVSFE